MSNDLLNKAVDMFMNVNTLFIFMTIVEPVDLSGLRIIFNNSAFSHWRSACIACYIPNAFLNVIVILIFSFSGIDIEAIFAYAIEILLKMSEVITKLWRKNIENLIHPGFSELLI